MNRKNLVIALVVSLAVTGASMFWTTNPTKVGSNEVSEVPSVVADVPTTLELPLFKYSHFNEMVLNVQKGKAEATKKETLVRKAETVKPVAAVKKVEKTVATKKKVNSFRKYDIPLSDSMQSLIWELCKKENVDYELVLAIISAESSFDAKAVSWDNSSRGLMQMNTRTTFYPMARELGIKSPNVFDAEDNVRVGVHYIATLFDAWDSKYSGSLLQKHAILSYRFGVAGSKHRSLNHSYVRKVERIQKSLRTKGELS
jgi:hypothetical protein